MASKVIRPRRDEGPLGSGWQSIRESAPSVIRAQQPTGARWVALISLMFAALGGAALVFAAIPRPYLIGAGWGVMFLTFGIAGLLYHAFVEKELQYRRVYAAVGTLLWVLGVGLRLLPAPAYEGASRDMGGLWLAWGSPAMLVALGFLVSFARNEDDTKIRGYVVNGFIGGTGLVLSLIGGVIGYFNEAFLVTQGMVSLILGLCYLGVFVGMQERDSDRAYYGGWLIALLGGAMVLVVLITWLGPWVMYWLRPAVVQPSDQFLMPRGLLLMYVGLEFLFLGVCLSSNWQIAVLTRREMASAFFSPIAYIVIIGTSLVGWFMFVQFVQTIFRVSEDAARGMGPPLMEPIVVRYIVGYFPIFCAIFIVPILTMRLLSEEKRSGTLEVLLTAPVNEIPVVLSKFFAAFRIYLLAWLPWGVYLIALRVEGGEEFDYRPLLGFFIALAACGAGFLAMGLFFSALTRNQMAAAILTFVFMVFLTLVFFLKFELPEDSTVRAALKYISYLDLWIDTLLGTLAPKYLVYHVSAAIFWLFLTVKVLEARKWS
jgi:ABC-type transport system involved in multi-copper enzyme maturation permease subunit